MIRKKSLDTLDLQILSALNQLGGKASAELLSQILNHPARTIRYRLSKLKEAGYLKFLYAMTHDRKLGLGDALLTLDLSPGVSNLDSLFHDIPLFYLYGSTIGQHNGHLAHFTYPLKEDNLPERICKSLLERGLIKDYSVHDTIDIIFSPGQIEHLDIRSGWQWDWQEWAAECKKTTQAAPTDPSFDFDVVRAKFDARDIAILSHLKVDAAMTLKELGVKVGLSQTQVNKRIKRMEHDGIIKGYRWTTEHYEEPLHLYLYLTVDDSTDPLLSCLYNLPFPKEMIAANQTDYVIRLLLYPSSLTSFLCGFDLIRGHLKSYRTQLVYHLQSIQMGRLFSSFDSEQDDWVVDVGQYLQLIDNFQPPSD